MLIHNKLEIGGSLEPPISISREGWRRGFWICGDPEKDGKSRDRLLTLTTQIWIKILLHPSLY